MDRSMLLDQCLALAAGELRDGTGGVLTSPRPILVQTDDGPRAAAQAALASGVRVAMALASPPPGRTARLVDWLTTRHRVARAKRWLAAAGATRVRTLAAIPSRDSLFLVYELGAAAEAYVDRHLVLRTRGTAGWISLVKSAIAVVAGVDSSVELIVVVGERR